MSIEQLEGLLARGGVAGQDDDLKETGKPAKNAEPEEEETEDVDAEVADESEEAGKDDDEAGEEVEEIDASIIAEALGVAEEDLFVDDDGKVGIRAKVNGEEIRASLSDLRKSYQLQKNLDDKAHAFNQERAQFQQWAQSQAQAFNREVGIADAIINQQAEKLAEQYQSIDWDRLRQADPAEWSARRQEFQSAYQSLKGQKESVASEVEQQQQAMQQQYAAQWNEMLRYESQELVKILPDWSDQAVAKREWDEIQGFLRASGYGEHELNITDHRAISLARKAMLYDKQAGAEPAGKKVRKVRRVMPSGSLKTPVQKAEKIRKARIARQRKTGSEIDTVAALEALL